MELNAPKGMEIADGELHVADIDHLRTFDAETGAPIDYLEIEGAKFLNDIAIAPDGTLYVTDTGTKDVPGAIYEVSADGEVSTLAKGRHLERPNGIDLDREGNLIVVTFAGKKVLTISKDGEVLETTKVDAGKLDGLVVRDDGSRLVSSWDGKHIVRIAPDGTAKTVLTGVRTPAAFGFDEERQRLLVPLVKENKVVAAPLQ